MRIGWLAVALVASLAPFTQATPASSTASNPIQPGDSVTTPVGGCTLNFVFDGPGGATLIGTAGHCGDLGHSVSAAGHTNFGTIVYDDDTWTDFALIQVAAAAVASVSAAVKGHPAFPVGYTTSSEVGAGDLLRLSGYGMGFGFTQVTQEQRVAALGSQGTTHYCAHGPAIFGDSGGPVLHDESKEALGIVASLGGTCVFRGASVEGAMARAAINGFPVTLRTV